MNIAQNGRSIWIVYLSKNLTSSGAVLHVLEEHSESLILEKAIEPVSAETFIQFLDRLISVRGLPALLKVDYDQLFCDRIFASWAVTQGITIHHTPPNRNYGCSRP